MPSLTIAGLEFDLPTRYAEGHLCTSTEAGELESLRRSRIASNFAKVIERMRDTPGESLGAGARAVHEAFAAYAASYVLGAPRGTDPVTREATRLATDLALEELRKRGKKRGEVDDGAWTAAVARLAASPAVLAEARTRVEASRKILSEALDLDL